MLSPSQEAELLSLINENRASANAEAFDQFLLDVRTYLKQYDDETGCEICEHLFYIPVNLDNQENGKEIVSRIQSSLYSSSMFCDYEVEVFDQVFKSRHIPMTVNDQVSLFNGGVDDNNHSSSEMCFIAGKVKVKVYEQEHFGDDIGGAESVEFAQLLNDNLSEFEGVHVRGVCFEPTTLLVEATKSDYEAALKQLGSITDIIDLGQYYQIQADSESLNLKKPNLHSYLDQYQLTSILNIFS